MARSSQRQQTQSCQLEIRQTADTTSSKRSHDVIQQLTCHQTAHTTSISSHDVIQQLTRRHPTAHKTSSRSHMSQSDARDVAISVSAGTRHASLAQFILVRLHSTVNTASSYTKV